MYPDFLRFLGLFRFNLRYVQTGIENGQLFIRLRGPWLHVILFEVPMLAIVSEVRNRYRYQTVTLRTGPRAVVPQVRLADGECQQRGTVGAASGRLRHAPTLFVPGAGRSGQSCSSMTSPGASLAPATCTWPASWT